MFAPPDTRQSRDSRDARVSDSESSQFTKSSRLSGVYKSSLYGGRETPEPLGSASKASLVGVRRSLNSLSHSMDALSLKALTNRTVMLTPPTKVMSFGARPTASGLRSSIPSLPSTASRQLDQQGRPLDPGASLTRKSLQPSSNASRLVPTHLMPQPYTPQRNTVALGGRPRHAAPVVTPVLGSHPGVYAKVATVDGENSDSSECPGSMRWGSVSAEDSARTLNDECSVHRHSISARPSELKSLLELAHDKDQQLQQQTQALQDERASWSGTVSRLKEAESAAQRMREEREALEIDVQILRQKLAALECSGNAVATTSSVFQQMLTKSVTERLILASDTNVALQGVSSMQEQLRVALQMLSRSEAQLKDAVNLVQGLRERLDVAEARVTQLQLQSTHEDLTHKVREAELLQLGADSLSKAETLQARSATAERRTEELQIDIETLNQQFEWLQHQAQVQQQQAWQKEQLLQLQQQQLAASAAAAGNTQLARNEEQLVMKERLRKLEDDLAAAVAATVQERVQTMMKTRRSDQQAKVIYGLQQRELELSQEKDNLLCELTLPSPRLCELARELQQVKIVCQEKLQALLETQHHLQAARQSQEELRGQLRMSRTQLEEGLGEKVEMQERSEEVAAMLLAREVELATAQQRLQASLQGQDKLELQLQQSRLQLETGMSDKADSDSRMASALAAMTGREQEMTSLQQEKQHLQSMVDTHSCELAESEEQVGRLQSVAQLNNRRIVSMGDELQAAKHEVQELHEQTQTMRTNEANLLNRLFTVEGERQGMMLALDQSRGESATLCLLVEEVARLTEDLGQLNASGKLSCILVQQHLESILRHKAENQSLEAEILRLRGIEESVFEVQKVSERRAGQLLALRTQVEQMAEHDITTAAEMRLLKMQAGENCKLHSCIAQLREEVTLLSASSCTQIQPESSLSMNTDVCAETEVVKQAGFAGSTTCPREIRQRHPCQIIASLAARLILVGGAAVCTSRLTISKLRHANLALVTNPTRDI